MLFGRSVFTLFHFLLLGLRNRNNYWRDFHFSYLRRRRDALASRSARVLPAWCLCWCLSWRYNWGYRFFRRWFTNASLLSFSDTRRAFDFLYRLRDTDRALNFLSGFCDAYWTFNYLWEFCNTGRSFNWLLSINWRSSLRWGFCWNQFYRFVYLFRQNAFFQVTNVFLRLRLIINQLRLLMRLALQFNGFYRLCIRLLISKRANAVGFVQENIEPTSRCRLLFHLLLILFTLHFFILSLLLILVLALLIWFVLLWSNFLLLFFNARLVTTWVLVFRLLLPRLAWIVLSFISLYRDLGILPFLDFWLIFDVLFILGL